LTQRKPSSEHGLEQAVSRALRDNLIPLQRTADELQQAYSDLIAACSSTRPSNALPAMLRAQTAASALAAGLSVLSNFVAIALKPRDESGYDGAVDSAVAEPEPEAEPVSEAAPAAPATDFQWAEEEAQLQQAAAETPVVSAAAEAPAFDVASLSTELQELHRRANRVAKVAMQDIKLLRPKDVRLGHENKDICVRLRNDLDKARKEYDRRFRAIQDHPVDYFHHWMVEILGGGDPATLGEYPYPSPVLRH